LAAKRKRGVSEEIFEQLKETIVSGRWAPGERLPSEQKLMEQFGASRISVREPLKQLASLGLVETRQGAGTFVRGFNSSSFIAPMQSILAQRLNKEETLALMEVRQIEVIAAGLAASRCTEADTERLHEIHARLERAHKAENYEKHRQADLDFHLHICGMSGNQYLSAICRLMYEAIDCALLSIVKIMGSHLALHYHGLLIDTISRHYVHEARAVMEEHIQTTIDAVKAMPADSEVFANGQ
jgi:GntR family transcriptional repressor for pyruvate dehydrogenase complex